ALRAGFERHSFFTGTMGKRRTLFRNQQCREPGGNHRSDHGRPPTAAQLRKSRLPARPRVLQRSSHDGQLHPALSQHARQESRRGLTVILPNTCSAKTAIFFLVAFISEETW